MLKALAHPTRLKILEKLQDGPCCVCKIIPYVGGEQSNVSHHLAILKRAGIVRDKKKGKEVWYEVCDPAVFSLLRIINQIILKNLKNKQKIMEVL